MIQSMFNMKILNYFMEYSMLAMKIRLADEHPYDPVTGKQLTGNVYTIALPIAVCTPFNAKHNWCYKTLLNAGNT